MKVVAMTITTVNFSNPDFQNEAIGQLLRCSKRESYAFFGISQ